MALTIFLLVAVAYVGVLAGFIISWVKEEKFTKKDERKFQELFHERPSRF